MSTLTPLRHERDTGKIVGRLRDVADMVHDIVAPANALAFRHDEAGATLHLDSPEITEDGVWDKVPVTVNRTAYRQAAERLNIPVKYLDQCVADDMRSLEALNLNARASQVGNTTLFRLLKTPERWTLRGVLSDGYQAIDNMDVLTAVANGMTDADIDLADCEVEADWSDDRFRLRLAVPAISLLVPDLLGDYRSPYLGKDETPPVIWAGLEVSNSETGQGAASLTPRAVVLVCRNGMTRNQDIVRSIHVGSKLEAGVVTWSASTRRKAVELLQSKVTDAVKQFCSVGYLELLANEMRTAKGLPVENVTKAFEKVKVDLGFSEAEIEQALTCFMRSGDNTVLGIGQAITAAAQLVEDGDRQNEMEQTFWSIVNKPHAFTG